ncbi:nitronate monooxygenase [Sphingomonas profundi]|uniref:NAD(P)H-dependent flavin oxidoreductase n=1 Tax=Alterirhizorhabdus profundi TaxID=2681549 RepID=UPI0030D1A324
MFIASTADLVIAQCRAGIIGSMPALNPRSTAALDEDIARIREAVGGAPYCINLVAHRSNDRLHADLDVILRHKVPIVVLALAANADLVRALQANGSLVFQDVIKDRHARKCAEMGVDGIIAIGAGAGGHTGDLSPFALMQEIRRWWDGLLILSGCIATGRSVLAAEVLGADLAYIGSAFLASTEANTQAAFKQMIVDSAAKDIALTNCFTGVNANFLIPSIRENGLDPAALVRAEGAEISIAGGGSNSKAWRDIWSAGQGIGAVTRSEPAADYIDWLVADYAEARAAMGMTA